MRDELAKNAAENGTLDFDYFLKTFTVKSDEREIDNRLIFKYYEIDYDNHSDIGVLGYWMQSNIQIKLEEGKAIVECFASKPKHYINDNVLTLLYSAPGDSSVIYNLINLDMNTGKIWSQEEFKELYNVQEHTIL